MFNNIIILTIFFHLNSFKFYLEISYTAFAHYYFVVKVYHFKVKLQKKLNTFL